MTARATDEGRGRAALQALRAADPVLARLIDATPDGDLWTWRVRWPERPFALLARSIVGQQISTQAANAIFGRLSQTLGGDVSAHMLTSRSDEALLEAGLSRAKLASLRDLSACVLSGELPLDRTDQLSDDELRRRLTAVRGIGTWTAELFLLALGRDDALPAADVGLRRAVRQAYGLDGLPSTAEVEALGERWRPHRSLAALLLYRSLRPDAGLE